jgi:NDP-sugar pyrophosphorylase family protein
MAREAMDALILAGGLGTRLASAVRDTPKVLAPVHGRPFIDYLFAHLAASDLVSRVILAVGHGAGQIADHLDAHPPALPVVISREDTPLDTGGAVALARGRAPSDPFLVLNGDSFTELDYHAFARFHADQQVPASLVAVQTPDTAAFGSVDIVDDRITRFTEKSATSGPGWVNAGIYMFSTTVLAALPDGVGSLERQILPGLADGRLAAFRCDEPFLDIGTPSRYALTSNFFKPLQ